MTQCSCTRIASLSWNENKAHINRQTSVGFDTDQCSRGGCLSVLYLFRMGHGRQ